MQLIFSQFSLAFDMFKTIESGSLEHGLSNKIVFRASAGIEEELASIFPGYLFVVSFANRSFQDGETQHERIRFFGRN